MTLEDRRALGQYFTPRDLVDHVLDRAAVDTLPDGARVLEPACGDGAFLVGLVRRLGPRAARLAVEAFEVDPAAAAEARRRVADALIRHGGLEAGAARRQARSWIREADFLSSEVRAGVALALGNPPFLEAKRMPREMKVRLKSLHPRWTRGAFDLYVPFVGAASEVLAPGGRLAFVLPNKVSIAAYARDLRRDLLERLRLTDLTDLWDSRAFADAAVYPVVVTARLPASGEAAPEDGVATWQGRRDGERLAFVQTGRLSGRVLRGAPDRVLFVLPEAPAARAEVEALLDPPARLGDYLDLRWTVSFHRAGLRDRYLFPERPDSPHARPLLGAGRFEGNRDVQRYHLTWRGWWIDYDRERAGADHNHLPDPRIFEAPKLVICQNALRLRAALDREGYVLKDTYFAARPNDRARAEGVSLEALLGVLNSDLLHRWYETLFGMTRVNGGYLHYLGAYLKHLPLPAPDRLRDAGLEAAVRSCEAAAPRGEAALAAPAAEVERRVRAAFGLPPAGEGSPREVPAGSGAEGRRLASGV